MSPIFVGNRRIYGPESSDPSGLGASDEGSIVYNTTDDKLKAWDGSAWNALGGGAVVSNDPGAGGGFAIAAGADNSAATLTSTTSTMYFDSWIDSQGASGTPLDYNTGSFAFHTGHNQNSTQWPFHFAVQVSTANQGVVANLLEWKKHSNACGNVDVYGSNQAITSSNFTNTNLYTYLGRVHMGGGGSGPDGTLHQGGAWFNNLKYGYRWIMFKVQDIAGPSSYGGGQGEMPAPEIGTLNGWAMYGFRVKCTGQTEYATLGRNQNGGTLSNGNLTYSMGSGTFRTEATASVWNGKWYWEATANSGTTNGSVGGRVGVCVPFNASNPESNRLGIFWHSTAGLTRHVKTPSYSSGGGTFSNLQTGTNYGDGDVIGVALDMDSSVIYFYKNGTLAYTYNFAGDKVGAGQEFTAHCWNASSGTPSWTYNFGATNFAYSVPTGFNAGLWK